MVNKAKNLLIMRNNLQQTHLTMLQIEWSKKLLMQLVIWLVIKLLIELRKSQKLHNTIIQRHDKEIPKESYISPEKDRRLLMTCDWYNSIIMKYQKIISLLENTPSHRSKFKTKKWVEIKYGSRDVYNTNSQIKFKTSMLSSGLCDNSDAYILVTETVTVPNTVTQGKK